MAGRMPLMAQQELKAVARAADAIDAARERLRDAAHAANKSGESVRDIASYARASPTKIQKLLQEARRLEEERGPGA
jgi:hypothetical protein